MRGLAAISVVLFHLRHVPKPALPPLPDWMTRVADFGSSGVLLFFVISGFSLSMTMRSHLRSPHPILSYGLSRFFRIAPLFYVLIPISLLADLIWSKQFVGFKAVLLSFTFLFNLVPGREQGIVWASWTIGVEMIFYALFPLLYRLGSLAALGATMAAYLVFIAVIGPVQPASSAHWTFIGFLPLFAIGMATYDIFTRIERAPPWAGGALMAAGLAVLAACCAATQPDTAIYFRVPVAVGYAMLLLGCGIVGPRMIVNRVTTFLGCISYAVYLLHARLLYLLSPLFAAATHGLSGVAAYCVAIAIALAVLIPLAYGAFRLVERPFDQFRRRFDNRLIQADLAKREQAATIAQPAS